MASTAPIAVTVYAYHVGFGDCLLVKFEYATRNRFVLIDFGTTKLPPSAAKGRMLEVARDIEQKVGSSGLQAVVATHRHQDHVSGFATNEGATAPGDVIAALRPRLVSQPWTEHPDLPEDAVAARGPHGGGVRFAKALAAMHEFSAEVVRFAASAEGKRRLGAAAREQLSFIGEDNLRNLSAVRNLMRMGLATKREYLHFGAKSKLASLLPGVKVHVLGPPTVEQHDNVRNQNPENKEEYWHLGARTLGAAQLTGRRRLFPNAETVPGTRLPAYARWLAYRVREASEEELLALVRALDDELNNTSLILLFETGGKKFLFPGDAQWENWEYALSKPEVRSLLADVNLYKVGHHGSLNATPKTMWNLLKNKGPASKKGRLETVLSTLPGKHGSEKNNSEVPRKTLLAMLQDQSDLHSTDELQPGQLCTETRVPI